MKTLNVIGQWCATVLLIVGFLILATLYTLVYVPLLVVKRLSGVPIHATGETYTSPQTKAR